MLQTITPERPRHARSASAATGRAWQDREQKVKDAMAAQRVLPAILVAYSCLLPRDLTLTIANVDFRPYRVTLILVLPLLLRLVSAARLRLSSYDAIALFVAVWAPISLIATSSLSDVVSVGFSMGGDFILAYYVGRICLQTPDDVRRLMIAFAPGCALAGLSMALESILHVQFVRPTVNKLLGQPSVAIQAEVRWGLLRALGPFPHPILAGAFMASLLPFALLVLKTPRDRLTLLFAACCAIFTVSSTSIVNFMIGLIFFCALYAQRITRLPLIATGASLFPLALVAIGSFSQNGLMSFLIRRLSVNAANGYYRMEIWKYAGAEANNNPLFGIGIRDWIRPSDMPNDTIDANWLLLTMRYGYPLGMAVLVLFLGGAIALALRSSRFRLREDTNVAAAVVISILGIVTAGISVALWEGIWVWLIMLSGCAVSLASFVRPAAWVGVPPRAKLPRRPAQASARRS